MIFSNCIFSQINVYKPFPLIGTWVVQSYGPCGPDYGGCSNAYYSYSRYEVFGDTTFGGYIYKNVTCANSMGNSYPGNVTYGPSIFCFAYRNDIPNKKVYLYINLSGQYKDTLWYDFNLNIGDTLKKTFSINSFSDSRSIVTSIDSVLICGVHYKKFQFNCQGEPGLDLIEGVGFIDNFVGTTPMCPFEPVYKYNTGFTCTLLSGKDEISASTNQIELFPNPVLNNLQINYPKQSIALPLKYSIVDCTGKVIFSGNLPENKSIDVSKLKNGLYFLRLLDKQQKTFQSKFLKL